MVIVKVIICLLQAGPLTIATLHCNTGLRTGAWNWWFNFASLILIANSNTRPQVRQAFGVRVWYLPVSQVKQILLLYRCFIWPAFFRVLTLHIMSSLMSCGLRTALLYFELASVTALGRLCFDNGGYLKSQAFTDRPLCSDGKADHLPPPCLWNVFFWGVGDWCPRFANWAGGTSVVSLVVCNRHGAWFAKTVCTC